jgi:hypothetical protein
MRVQVIEPTEQWSNNQRLGQEQDEALMLRLRQVETELADCVARSLDVDWPNSGLRDFYTLVVPRRRAIESEMYIAEAR